MKPGDTIRVREGAHIDHVSPGDEGQVVEVSENALRWQRPAVRVVFRNGLLVWLFPSEYEAET